MIKLTTPVDNIEALKVGDSISISGYIYCGRDAVLPRLVKLIEDGRIEDVGIELQGAAIFHTAVSVAGVGPTSSNKVEIEGSFEALSKAGVKLHIGKGKISDETVRALERYGSIYVIMPPITALLQSKILEQEVVAFEEEGMEAMHRLKVTGFPGIVAAAQGKSIYQ